MRQSGGCRRPKDEVRRGQSPPRSLKHQNVKEAAEAVTLAVTGTRLHRNARELYAFCPLAPSDHVHENLSDRDILPMNAFLTQKLSLSHPCLPTRRLVNNRLSLLAEYTTVKP